MPSGPEPGTSCQVHLQIGGQLAHRRLCAGPRAVLDGRPSAAVHLVVGAVADQHRLACRSVTALGRGAGASVAMRTSTAPTASVSPSAPPSSTIRPAYGLGISTSALSVSTVHSVWLSSTSSPTATLQLGDRRVLESLAEIGHQEVPHVASGSWLAHRLLDAVEQPVDAGQPQLLQPRRRVRRVETRWRATPAPRGRRTAPPGCARPVRRRSRACAAPSCITTARPVLRTDAATVSKSSGISDRRSMTSRLQPYWSAASSAAARAVCDQTAVGQHGDVVAVRRTAARPIGSPGRLVSTTSRDPVAALRLQEDHRVPARRSNAAAASRRPTASTAPPPSGPRCAPSRTRWTPNDVRPHRFRRTTGSGW